MQNWEKILVSGFDMTQNFVHINKLLMFGTMKWGEGWVDVDGRISVSL
jgi:hypothetical protein